MDGLADIAEFRSDRFSPVLPDECQVNPQVYGAELAFWLAGELARRGVATSYPVAEDWGWYIEFSTPDDAEFAVHCGNVGGAVDHWFLQLRRFGRKLFGRDKPPYSDAAPLVSAIEAILRDDASVTQLDWRYDATGRG